MFKQTHINKQDESHLLKIINTTEVQSFVIDKKVPLVLVFIYGASIVIAIIIIFIKNIYFC